MSDPSWKDAPVGHNGEHKKKVDFGGGMKSNHIWQIGWDGGCQMGWKKMPITIMTQQIG